MSLDEKSLNQLDRIIIASENLQKQIEGVLEYIRNKPIELKEISFNELLDITLKSTNIPEMFK